MGNVPETAECPGNSGMCRNSKKQQECAELGECLQNWQNWLSWPGAMANLNGPGTWPGVPHPGYLTPTPPWVHHPSSLPRTWLHDGLRAYSP